MWAATAKRLGLVNAVFPLAEFDDRAAEWLGRVGRQSASSVRLARKAFRLAQSDHFASSLNAREHLYLGELMKTEDAREGLEAFLAKRKPHWRNR